MNLSGKILNNLNEAVDEASKSDYKEFNNQISFLIDDEQEAIDGYEKALNILKDKMTDYQYVKISEVLNHIIDEEKEHIEELNKLRDELDLTSSN